MNANENKCFISVHRCASVAICSLFTLLRIRSGLLQCERWCEPQQIRWRMRCGSPPGRQCVTGVAHTDASHSGTVRGFDSRGCILDNDTALGWYSEPRGCRQKDFRIGLPVPDVFRGNDCTKAACESRNVEHHFDVQARRRRSDRLPPSLLMKPSDPAFHPGQWRHSDGADEITIHGFLCVANSNEPLRIRCAPEPTRNNRIIS
jgi:hypothetical protein